MLGMDRTGNVVGLPQMGRDRQLKIGEWLIANGLNADSFIELGAIPNYLVGQILREADVALFTNRCEGGTNLVAMESMACGIPTILSANTGHLDLIADERCYPLRSQTSVQPTRHFSGVDGWGESQIEEVVETLEFIYQNRPDAEKRGKTAADFMQNWTWEKQVHRIMDAIGELIS
jgi:glycosyltransferase involved in cell wall biosynthesis